MHKYIFFDKDTHEVVATANVESLQVGETLLSRDNSVNLAKVKGLENMAYDPVSNQLYDKSLPERVVPLVGPVIEAENAPKPKKWFSLIGDRS